MFYGAREIVLPDNADDMKPHCAEEKSAVKCLSDYSKNCLKGFKRQLFQIVLGGGARNIRERCMPEGAKRYLKVSSCIIKSFDKGHDCMDIVKRDVALVRRNPEKKEWITSGCCMLDKFKSCFRRAIEPHCNKEGKEFADWAMKGYIGDIEGLACNSELKYDAPKCVELMDKVKMKKGEQIVPPRSLFVPLYQMLLEFGDEQLLPFLELFKNAPFYAFQFGAFLTTLLY
ncbi:hypothetical protein HDE_09631 [Halotydeus destructor]|nr:hypothetical protein HDE_09631 [Halotydeus destructor]